MQNIYSEDFNSLYSELILDAYLFFDLNKVRVFNDECIVECSTKITDKSLGINTPYEWKMNLV